MRPALIRIYTAPLPCPAAIGRMRPALIRIYKAPLPCPAATGRYILGPCLPSAPAQRLYYFTILRRPAACYPFLDVIAGRKALEFFILLPDVALRRAYPFKTCHYSIKPSTRA